MRGRRGTGTWLPLTALLLAGCAGLASVAVPQTGEMPPAARNGTDPSTLLDPRTAPLLDRRPVTGLARDPSGQPLVGATLQAYPVGAAVPGSEAQLVSNQTGSFRVRAASGPLVTATDASGSFSLPLPPGRYNVELVTSDERLKAWTPALEIPDGETPVPSLGTLVARPPGVLEGTLEATDPAFTNFLGTEVFIPGSPYLFKMATGSRTFRIEGLPEGEFEVVGWKGSPRSEAHARVRIRSGETTRLDRLLLEPIRPTLSGIFAEDGEPTDSAAPGATVEIRGARFGVSTGEVPTVRIGVLVDPGEFERRTDSLLRFRVPEGASNGPIEVGAGGYFDQIRAFRVLSSVRWLATLESLGVFRGGQQPDLLGMLDIRDTAGQPVREDGVPGRKPPNVRFWLDDDRANSFRSGHFPDVSPGPHTLHVSAGKLPDVPLRVDVIEAGGLPEPHLAPGDSGNPAVHHDFVIARDGVESTFVWIPVFQAYQLIVPARCGPELADRPVGDWVASRPAGGVRDVDWAVETFGGFYAAKYEASRADASPGIAGSGDGATEGSVTQLKVARYCIPWGLASWNEAKEACEAFDPHAHLMRDDEWTALAVWAMTRGVTVHGHNTNDSFETPGHDHDDPEIHFVQHGGWGLTGSGRKAGWMTGVNLTTHTATEAGVFDLNGNEPEWTASVGYSLQGGEFTIDGVSTGFGVPEDGGVSGLITDARWRRFGLPGTTDTSGSPRFGEDEFLRVAPGGGGDFRIIRGGTSTRAWMSGLWSVWLLDSGEKLAGFRPVLRY
ncbi:MAG: carboxypeptidase-like regulatory domain-containing protein [bacterium]|nr:carboxypeptidase-like regulatory domain-containing protein [bacterium]